ncbi:potassium transporter [Legionella jordanis]|uniref:cation:proton antiporter domain-containing protein n=1 Tax=Legionella jordanis TaxID=456 RepID=UPI000EFF8547|nr:cation:proton antiporter [Legionella jordanis]RMX20915.1 potassium transporter [Legionella jordanis]
MNYPILETVLIVLLTVLLVNIAFRLFRLPLILGYLVVGILVGPHSFGWIPDSKAINSLSEFGVVFLMFTVGLEFSFTKLLALKYAVFVLGVLQVLLSILITAAIGLGLTLSFMQSIALGCVVAMSSTALVVKLLNEDFQIHTKYGSTAIGILLFQDLAVIPILVIISSLTSHHLGALYYFLLIALGKAVIAIAVILSIGRWLLRPLFHTIAATRMTELFSLSVLFVAIGSAWITARLGMTLALGAFLSGLMLGETQFRHQIKQEIRPFRDVLLGLFFVSIGMLADLRNWIDAWFWIVLLLSALMFGKTMLVVLLCRLTGFDGYNAIRTGIVLGQGGEFGFAILSLALTSHLLPLDYGQVVLASLIISFAFAPFMIRHNQQIAQWFLPSASAWNQEETGYELKQLTAKLNNHVIICGFGRVGQNLAYFLNRMGIPYVAFDLDPSIVHNATLAGESVIYGNVTHPELLTAAKPQKAAAVVISFDDVQTSLNLLHQLKQFKIPILVRCKDEAEFAILRDKGATRVVTEVFEESLTLVNYLLQILHIPKEKIQHVIQHARANNYKIMSHFYPGSFLNEMGGGLIYEHLRPVYLPEQAYAIARSIDELDLSKVEVVAIRRENLHLKPQSDTRLQAGDTLILYGLPDYLDEAEAILLQG